MAPKPLEVTCPDELSRALLGSLRKALLILGLPAFEFVFLRVFLKQGLGLQFGWRYLTDWDFLVPLPLALSIVILVLERVRAVSVGWNFQALAFNLGSLVTFLGLNFQLDALSAYSPVLTISLWTLNAFLVILSAFVVRVRMISFLTNPNRWVFLPGLLIGTASIYSAMLLAKVWPFLSGWAATGSCTVLGSLLNDVNCFVTTNQGPRMIIRHVAMAVSVGKGCGGLDAFFLFFYVMLLLWLIVPQWFSKTQWLLLAILGLPLMYLLNVIRISAFFLIAVACKNIFGFQVSTDLLLALFHTHSGWLLFFSGILAYLKVADRLFRPIPSPAVELTRSPL